MGILEGEKGEKGTEEILEIIMTKNFTKLISDIKPKITSQVISENAKQEKRKNKKKTDKQKLYLGILLLV